MCYYLFMSKTVGSLIIIVLLIFFFPLGVIFMWFVTHWPKRMKVLITLLPVFLLVFILSVFILMDLLHVLTKISITNGKVSIPNTPRNEQLDKKTVEEIQEINISGD